MVTPYCATIFKVGLLFEGNLTSCILDLSEWRLVKVTKIGISGSNPISRIIILKLQIDMQHYETYSLQFLDLNSVKWVFEMKVKVSTYFTGRPHLSTFVLILFTFVLISNWSEKMICQSFLLISNLSA